MSQPNVAILGTGGIAHMHAAGVLKEKGILSLAAACDVDPHVVAQFAAQYGIPKWYTDYREVINDPDIDAIIVSTPHDLHEVHCVAAARAGKHILVEKPITRTVREAANVIEEARKADIILMAGHNQRYIPAYRKIHDLLAAKTIGEVFCARIDHHQNFDRPVGNWWRSKAAVGGGCVIGSGIHRLDLLRWFLGEPIEVFAYAIDDPTRLEAEVAVAASIKWPNGAIGEFFCNWGVYNSSSFGEGIWLFGREGNIYKDGNYENRHTVYVTKPDQRKSRDPLMPVIAADGEYESMWAHFARCIETGEQPLTDGLEGRKSLELVQAIYRSIETGRPVRLPPK